MYAKWTMLINYKKLASNVKLKTLHNYANSKRSSTAKGWYCKVRTVQSKAPWHPIEWPATLVVVIPTSRWIYWLIPKHNKMRMIVIGLFFYPYVYGGPGPVCYLLHTIHEPSMLLRQVLNTIILFNNQESLNVWYTYGRYQDNPFLKFLYTLRWNSN